LFHSSYGLMVHPLPEKETMKNKLLLTGLLCVFPAAYGGSGAGNVWPDDPALTQLSVGESHACAIASSGRAYCWGRNISGELGNGSTTNSADPVAVSTSGALAGRTFKQISAGSRHTCAIASDDWAYCWGVVPVAVSTGGALAGKTFRQLSTGTAHTCAIASDDQAYCWGSSSDGKLGNGSISDRGSAVPVAVNTSGALAGKTIKQISAGSRHTCAIASDDQAYCWGRNGDSGTLGNNSITIHSSAVPVAVSTGGVLAGKTIKQISAGFGHTCAIASDEQAYCWGWNNGGQLGNNSTADSAVPVAVSTGGALAGKTIKQISAGSNHTCAIASDGQAYCWGWSLEGALGTGSTTSSAVPVPVSTGGALAGGKTFTQIGAGSSHTCAIASGGQAYCWGRIGWSSYVNDYGPVPALVPRKQVGR